MKLLLHLMGLNVNLGKGPRDLLASGLPRGAPHMIAGLASYPRARWACLVALADRRGSVASYLAALLPSPSPSVSTFLASPHWFSSVTGTVVLAGHRVAMDTASVGHYCIWWPFHHQPPAYQSMSFIISTVLRKWKGDPQGKLLGSPAYTTPYYGNTHCKSSNGANKHSFTRGSWQKR